MEQTDTQMELSEEFIAKYPNLKSCETILDPQRVINPYDGENDKIAFLEDVKHFICLSCSQIVQNAV